MRLRSRGVARGTYACADWTQVWRFASTLYRACTCSQNRRKTGRHRLHPVNLRMRIDISRVSRVNVDNIRKYRETNDALMHLRVHLHSLRTARGRFEFLDP